MKDFSSDFAKFVKKYFKIKNPRSGVKYLDKLLPLYYNKSV
jgi:hypothetical protein